MRLHKARGTPAQKAVVVVVVQETYTGQVRKVQAGPYSLFPTMKQDKVFESYSYPLSGLPLQFVITVQIIRVHPRVGGRDDVPGEFVLAADCVSAHAWGGFRADFVHG